jgi:hypothetical protein
MNYKTAQILRGAETIRKNSMKTTDTPRTDALSAKITRDGIKMLQEEIDSLELQLAHSLANQVKAQAEIERLKEKLTTISFNITSQKEY